MCSYSYQIFQTLTSALQEMSSLRRVTRILPGLQFLLTDVSNACRNMRKSNTSGISWYLKKNTKLNQVTFQIYNVFDNKQGENFTI